MNKDDEYKVVGEFVAKEKEADDELAKLRLEARRLGPIFWEVGQALQEDPTSVVFEGESRDSRFNSRVVVELTDLDPNRLHQLVTEYQRWTLQKENAQRAIDECKNRKS